MVGTCIVIACSATCTFFLSAVLMFPCQQRRFDEVGELVYRRRVAQRQRLLLAGLLAAATTFLLLMLLVLSRI